MGGMGEHPAEEGEEEKAGAGSGEEVLIAEGRGLRALI